MGIKRSRKVTPRLIVLSVLAGVGLYIIVAVVVTIIVWRHNDHLNAHRLKILQAESVLHCRVAQISPWHEQEEINADMVGTTHGIFFGGRAPTSLTRVFTLNGADPADVVNAFAACAQSSGWMLAKPSYAALSGTKSFSEGWTAQLNIYLGSHAPFITQPFVQINLSTPPV